MITGGNKLRTELQRHIRILGKNEGYIQRITKNMSYFNEFYAWYHYYLFAQVVILLVQFDWTNIFDSEEYLYGNLSTDNFTLVF